uniref:Uncharacterized protein n=1 Tax=Rhizophora mucronata TaxID=61149 RepID=A0A2P2R2A3_RHIMU
MTAVIGIPARDGGIRRAFELLLSLWGVQCCFPGYIALQ